MQETWKFFNLDAPDKKKKVLTPWLQEVIDRNGREMGIYLSYYFRKEGAVAENIRLVPPTSDLTKRTGSISVSFQLVHFNACLNIHDTNLEQMVLSYEISKNGNELTLVGPNWPEREPDEL
jgi:hypothetical protein